MGRHPCSLAKTSGSLTTSPIRPHANTSSKTARAAAYHSPQSSPRRSKCSLSKATRVSFPPCPLCPPCDTFFSCSLGPHQRRRFPTNGIDWSIFGTRATSKFVEDCLSGTTGALGIRHLLLGDTLGTSHAGGGTYSQRLVTPRWKHIEMRRSNCRTGSPAEDLTAKRAILPTTTLWPKAHVRNQ
jgi:hypothetical protein